MDLAKVLIENEKLKNEIKQLYKDWNFDSKRLLELKEENKKLIYDYKKLEFENKTLKEKLEDLKADFQEYKDKFEYCEACQI
jgi:predicted  nucleic acid-binding Zn-ribbon protein